MTRPERSVAPTAMASSATSIRDRRRTSDEAIIFRKNFRPGRMDFICNEESLTAHGKGELHCFSAGRSAEIEDQLAGLCVEQGGRKHRGGLLNIVGADLMEHMLSGSLLRRIIKAVFLPGNRREGKAGGGEKLPGRALQGVNAQGVLCRGFVGCEKSIVFLRGKRGFHFFKKILRQHHFITLS